ncbi:putative F-box protein At1g32420 [Lycium barbarum]|uniref:putative F-box protein At1g32420 n=1 Tax=Lycium barbarum TaxID=112863 RepID=UPI00293EB107|nr:putative F-box protein At1g32420 [Lycium barbarum]
MEEDKIIVMDNVYIPHETVFEILKRVPAKSLMRFRCVSKYFYSLISESSFIEAHHKSLVTQFFLLNRIALIPKHVIYNLSQREEDQDLANCPLRYLDEPCFRNLLYMHSINGLVCLWNHKGDVAICNPFIKEHVFLPKVPHIEKVSDSTTYLFGFDPTTKKHKVLMEYMAPYEYRSRVKYWIFTIGVDKSWREISGQFSKAYFTFWALISIACGTVRSAMIFALPLMESWPTIQSVLHGMLADNKVMEKLENLNSKLKAFIIAMPEVERVYLLEKERSKEGIRIRSDYRFTKSFDYQRKQVYQRVFSV